MQTASDRGKKKGQTHPKTPRCAGKPPPPVDHDKQRTPLWNFVLNELVHKLAINTFVALMAQDMLVGQVLLADIYLRRLILLEIVDDKTIHIKKFDKKWKDIVERRSPFSKEHTRFPGKQAPLMVHPVSDFGAAM